jgi:protein-disulfide isomerase
MSSCVPTVRGLRGALPVLLAIGFYLHQANPPSVWALDVPDVVATVQDQSITATDLTASVKGELLRLDMQRYKILKDGLDQLIAEHLTKLEAEKRQQSPAQLLQEEVTAKVPPVTPEQVKAFYESNKQRINQPFDNIQPRIEAYLNQQERDKRQNEFLRELRQRYQVKIALSPPKVDVSADDDPVLGAASAPVTIIEFSDFQCPYCRRVQPALKKLLAEYEGKVKLVFRDFPLRSIHPEAQKAAEAAQCANDQQQFWAYHDKLFDQTSLKDADLKKYAEELQLDVAQFSTCLDSGKYAKEVDADMQDGQSAGVNSTPSFFINGQPLSGAASFERFQELVDEALEQIQSAKQSSH